MLSVTHGLNAVLRLNSITFAAVWCATVASQNRQRCVLSPRYRKNDIRVASDGFDV